MGIHMMPPHYMKVVKKLHTATFCPDYHPETKTVDGWVGLQSEAGLSWALMHSALVGSLVSSETTLGAEALIMSHIPTSKWYQIQRIIVLVDISDLPPGADIQLVKLRFVSASKFNTFGVPSSINVFSSSPASDTDIVVEDYNQFGITPFSTAIDYDDWDASGASWNEFILNEAGLAVIAAARAGDGIVKLALREATYDAPNTPPVWASAKTISYNIGVANPGTGSPELVFEYYA